MKKITNIGIGINSVFRKQNLKEMKISNWLFDIVKISLELEHTTLATHNRQL